MMREGTTSGGRAKKRLNITRLSSSRKRKAQDDREEARDDSQKEHHHAVTDNALPHPDMTPARRNKVFPHRNSTTLHQSNEVLPDDHVTHADTAIEEPKEMPDVSQLEAQESEHTEEERMLLRNQPDDAEEENDIEHSGNEDAEASGEHAEASGDDAEASGDDAEASGEDIEAYGEDVEASGEGVPLADQAEDGYDEEENKAQPGNDRTGVSDEGTPTAHRPIGEAKRVASGEKKGGQTYSSTSLSKKGVQVSSSPSLSTKGVQVSKSSASTKKGVHLGGVCYLSRIPPHMKPLKLRHLLSSHAAIGRIYLAPEDATVKQKRKENGGNRGKNFTEGWVEFERKRDAKRVAELLNGEPIGGGHRSAYRWDLWNIKYLHGFKWDNLTEEIAYRNAVREQKLAAELRTAAKERDFYLQQVNKSKGLRAMEAKRRKRAEFDGEPQAVKSEPSTSTSPHTSIQGANIRRTFFQKNSVGNPGTQPSTALSKEILSKIFT